MQSSKEIVLGLDTSGSPLLLAVGCGDKKVFRRRKGVKQERLLFPALQEALAVLRASLQDVKRIFIVRGPGRFTGIRISSTFASMLKYLNNAEVRGAPLFEVLYRQAVSSKKFKNWKKQHPEGAVAVVLHAFREEYFLQIFDERQTSPAWLSREELLQRLSVYSHPLFVVGSDKNSSSLNDLLDGKFVLADTVDCFPRHTTLLEMSQEDIWEKDALEPLYLKPARFELIEPKP